MAGATGAGAGGILAATGLKGASAFGALMKAGFVGFSGTLGTTAGLLGAGGKFALGSSILAGGSAITPVAPTVVSSAALSTAPMTISSLPSTTALGATGTTLAPIAPISVPAGGLTSFVAPTSLAAPGTGMTLSSLPSLSVPAGGLTSFTPATSLAAPGTGMTLTAPTLPTPAAATSFSTTPGTSITASPVRIAKSRATSKKYGFIKDLKETLKGGIMDGTKSLVSNGLYNLVMHGDIKGEKFEQDLTATGGGQASSYMGSYALPSDIDFQASGIGGDTIGNTYVSMLQNLNYGTGSLDYARHTNMALMRGIQIPQIQYV